MLRPCRVALLALALTLALAGSASAATYDAHTVIVKLAPGVSTTDRAALFARTGVLESLSSIHGLGALVVRVSGDPGTVAQRLNASSQVLYAERNVILRATAIPNDPRFGELYGLNNTGQGGGTADADIDAPEALGRGGRRRLPDDRRRQGRHRRHGHHPEPRGPGRQDRGLRAVPGPDHPRGHDPDRQLHRRQRARDPRRRHDRGDRQQRQGRRGRRVRLAARDLQGAQPPRQRVDRRRGQLHHLGPRPGRQGHLDEPRRRRLDDAAQRRHLRVGRAAAPAAR